MIGLVGDKQGLDPRVFESMPGVEKAVPIMAPYKLASRDAKAEDTVILVGNAVIGGEKPAYMAGPCAVESREQIMETAYAVKEGGFYPQGRSL